MEIQATDINEVVADKPRRRSRDTAPKVGRSPNYRQLRHPFPAQEMFSADEIAAIHDTALRVLEELGMRVLPYPLILGPVPFLNASSRARASGWVFTMPATTASG